MPGLGAHLGGDVCRLAPRHQLVVVALVDTVITVELRHLGLELRDRLASSDETRQAAFELRHARTQDATGLRLRHGEPGLL